MAQVQGWRFFRDGLVRVADLHFLLAGLRWGGIRVLPLIRRIPVLKPPSPSVCVAGRRLLLASSAAASCLSSHQNQNLQFEMAEFAGKYKLVSSENFDDYMKALGVNMVTRKLANAASPVQDVHVNGDEFYIKTSTTFKTTEIKFKLGEEFDEHTGDGRDVKTTVTRDGNKLIQEQRGEKPSTLVREFDGDTMKMVLTVGDIVCIRVYKKD